MRNKEFKLSHPHVKAEIYYLTTADGGRSTPVHTGYRGQFHFNGTDWDAAQQFIDTNTCEPGQTVQALIQFASLHEIIALFKGFKFEVREGAKTVGMGIIIEILDEGIQSDTREKGLYKQIDEILFYEWDPLGVSDYEEARGEYYSYLPMMLRLKLQGADVSFIANHLFKIETETMGLLGNLQRCELVANRILNA